VRGQLRHRAGGPRHGHHRCGREAHHRHRLRHGLGQAGQAAARAPGEVGIIGAGPAGLAAAEELREEGLSGHVYDRYDRVGGLLIYGIPGFKLERIVERRADLLAGRRPSSC
jgi:NADPH-dependent glutamate synthase beta subunit-like oxidoreductase